jgi:hypothetical protein
MSAILWVKPEPTLGCNLRRWPFWASARVCFSATSALGQNDLSAPWPDRMAQPQPLAQPNGYSFQLLRNYPLAQPVQHSTRIGGIVCAFPKEYLEYVEKLQ